MNIDYIKKVGAICCLHHRIITFKILPATDTAATRIKLIDRHFNDSVTIPMGYVFQSAAECAVDYLLTRGFDVIGYNGTAVHGEHILIINRDYQPAKRLEVSK